MQHTTAGHFGPAATNSDKVGGPLPTACCSDRDGQNGWGREELCRKGARSRMEWILMAPNPHPVPSSLLSPVLSSNLHQQNSWHRSLARLGWGGEALTFARCLSVPYKLSFPQSYSRVKFVSSLLLLQLGMAPMMSLQGALRCLANIVLCPSPGMPLMPFQRYPLGQWRLTLV